MNHRHLAFAAALAVLASAPIAAQQEARYRDRSLLAVYVDLSSMSKEDAPRAVDALKKFLEGRRTIDELGAVIAYDGHSVRALQDFTEDIDLMQKALDQVQRLGDNAMPVDDATQLGALQEVIKKLGALPGKKAVVYAASGTPRGGQQVEAAIHEAVAANVALYPIDVRGLAAAGK